MHTNTIDLSVRHNQAQSRFETEVDGLLSVADYHVGADRTVMFTHTGVPSAQRGHGIAAALIKAALEWARDQKLRVVPACWYVAQYMRRHPETLDLLAH